MVKRADISLPRLTILSSHRCVWCGFESHTGHMQDKPSSVLSVIHVGTYVLYFLNMIFLISCLYVYNRTTAEAEGEVMAM